MYQTLRIGDHGNEVRALQDVSNFHIRRLAPLQVDGKFGPITQRRVMDFQQANGLQVDGVAGPKTQGKLFETETLPLQLGILPVAQSNPPGRPAGIQPPRLIPR